MIEDHTTFVLLEASLVMGAPELLVLQSLQVIQSYMSARCSLLGQRHGTDNVYTSILFKDYRRGPVIEAFVEAVAPEGQGKAWFVEVWFRREEWVLRTYILSNNQDIIDSTDYRFSSFSDLNRELRGVLNIFLSVEMAHPDELVETDEPIPDY